MGSDRKKRKHVNTPIKSHIKKGKTLSTQLVDQIPIHQMIWDKDLLPEFLWIDALARAYNNDNTWWAIFTTFMDIMDKYVPADTLLTGIISDFGKIPINARDDILKKEYNFVVTNFTEVIGGILTLYPECPALWLVPEKWRIENRIDPDVELKKLSNALYRLYPAKDDYCGLLRMFPFQRIIKKGRVKYPREICELISKYPAYLNKDDKYQVESLARMALNFIFQDQLGEKTYTFEWSKYFWRQNHNLSVCMFVPDKDLSPNIDKSRDFDYIAKVIHPKCEENIEILRKYSIDLILKVKVDLYDTEKYEVLFGLFSRCIRLYSSLLENPFMLSQDLSGIILRCLADTMITLCYLLNKNDISLFHKFIEYGQGKQKLLMLHLQDNYPDLYGPVGEDEESLRKQLGGFNAELLSINLGQWAGIDSRKMAEECNLMDVYRLIYDPTSSAVHGTWQNIMASNLERCANPLHRFHYLPRTKYPPLFDYPLIIATKMLNSVIDYSIDKAGFPQMDKKLNTFDDTKNNDLNFNLKRNT